LAILERDVALTRKVIGGATPPRGFGLAAARLADTKSAPLAEAALRAVGEDRIRRDPALALANASAAERAGHFEAAAEWLVLAQSLVDPSAPALAARIVLRLGLLHLRRAEITVARTLADWAVDFLGAHGRVSTDLLQLRALIADTDGDRSAAEGLYRRAIARSAAALTPLSRVIALHDLAETLSHRAPRESIALYGLALALIGGNQLDLGVRAAVANGMGYALLCVGDIEQAKAHLSAAAVEAKHVGRDQIELYARFNEAIAIELEGAIADAEQALLEIAARAATAVPHLGEWAGFRLLWLALERGAGADVAEKLRASHVRQLREPYADTVLTLRALVLADRHSREAVNELKVLVARYRARGDDLTAFVLEFWLAWAQHATGMTTAARRSFADACEVGIRLGFTVSPNWWSSRLVELAGSLASAEQAGYVATLWRPAGTRLAPEHSVIVHGEELTVDGATPDPSMWRRGKTGSRVLRRYFGALAAAHPAGIDRDELTDLLWPESEGDKAVRNLYWATRDLRDVLAGVEGLGVALHEQRYRLQAGPNVLFR
jgi:hypothetical protein